MRKLVPLFLILAGLSGCIGNRGAAVPESTAYPCFNRSDIIGGEDAPLARICGANGAAQPVAAPAAVSTNEFDRNAAMYMAGNAAMIATAPTQ